MAKKTIDDVDVRGKRALVRGKRALVRVDFNVPRDASGAIADDTRIRAALPTLRALLDRGAAVVLMSHLGRPKGTRDPKYSLAPVAARLSELLGQPVDLAPDCVGPEVEVLARPLEPGHALLLENLRFHPEEEANDPAFARELAALGDIYVDDAFGAAHRAHASTAGVAAYLPAVSGYLMEKELRALGGALEDPARPFAAVIGGAKVSSKLAVLRHLLSRVDLLLIGGGMANTFLHAQGHNVGASLLEPDLADAARALLEEAEKSGVRVMLPVDAVVAAHVAPDAAHHVAGIDAVPHEWSIVDIGPRTRALFADALRECRTVLWNGPMGVFEIPPFDDGTRAVARAIAGSGAVSIVGGGDSVAAVHQLGLSDRMTHISTGGGASLEFLTFTDPPKADAAASIGALHALDIAVKIITGDNGTVAAKVCRDLGLPPGRVVTGADLDALDDDALAAAIPETMVFARVNPEQKARIVGVARRRGEDVAFLGDGVNDAVALHAADVGISVDSATDVAKDAADIVLLEQDLGVLADGVREGRRIFANTLKYVLMATSSNFGNMFSAAGASLFLPFLPMLPSQILLNNLLYDVGQLAIPTDEVDPEVLARPAAWDIRFVRRFMTVFGPVSSIFDFLTFFVMLGILHAGHAEFRTGWFVESLATQTLVVFLIRTRRVPFFRSRPSRGMLITPTATAALGVILPFTPLAHVLGFSAFPVTFFLILFGMVLAYLALIEFAKSLFYATGRGRPARTPTSQEQRRGRRMRRRAGRFSLHSAA